MYGDKTEDNSGENNNEEYRAQFCSSFASPFVENFDTKMLDRATKILRKYNILHAKDFETWTQLVDAVKTEVQSLASEEEMLGEVPDEFLCQIMNF